MTADALGMVMRKRILSIKPTNQGYQIVATAESEEEVERYKKLYIDSLNFYGNNPIQLIPGYNLSSYYGYAALKRKDVKKLEYEQLFKAEQHVIMMTTMPVVTALVLITTHLSFNKASFLP